MIEHRFGSKVVTFRFSLPSALFALNLSRKTGSTHPWQRFQQAKLRSTLTHIRPVQSEADRTSNRMATHPQRNRIKQVARNGLSLLRSSRSLETKTSSSKPNRLAQIRRSIRRVSRLIQTGGFTAGKYRSTGENMVRDKLGEFPPVGALGRVVSPSGRRLQRPKHPLPVATSAA